MWAYNDCNAILSQIWRRPSYNRSHAGKIGSVSKTTISVCVFCGSRWGVSPKYRQAASEIGKLIASQNWQLVYGAGNVGLMGDVSQAASDAGGKIFGVIPQHLVNMEVARDDLDHLIVTETMHERKKVMIMNASAFVILPGGFGSLDEFFEILTWRQLGLHDKPIILVNVDHYWDELVSLVDKIIAEKFADQEKTDQLFDVVNSSSEALRVLCNQIS